jgi:hypothetical protein
VEWQQSSLDGIVKQSSLSVEWQQSSLDGIVKQSSLDGIVKQSSLSVEWQQSSLDGIVKQVSLASNIYPMMLSSPQEWNACAHSVATHDSQQSESVSGMAAIKS